MQELQVSIGASPFFICGGTPRDKYLGRLDRISDLDITTGDKTVDYLSQEFFAELKKQYKVSRKIMTDGHSSIFIGNLKIDFSSNFIIPEINDLLIKKGIANPTSLQKEMYSRDFTCNALLLTPDLKELLDITKSGFKDIKDRTIKTCLDPSITLTRNRNRTIRAIYLASKLDFNIDKSIIEYVKNNPDVIKISTPSSLKEKLDESFTWDPDKTDYLLTQMNLWNYIPITDKAYPFYMKKHRNDNHAKI